MTNSNDATMMLVLIVIVILIALVSWMCNHSKRSVKRGGNESYRDKGGRLYR